MPEGHTLHRIANGLGAAFVGAPVGVSSPQGRFAQGAALLDGRVLEHAEAYGKQLFLEFEGERILHVHLGLIGTFVIDSTDWAGEKPVTGQVRLRLQTEEHVADLRGPMVCAVVTPAQAAATIDRLGPDPLRADADPERAWEKIHRSGKSIAELLMDQSVLAGVGNIYRAEVLYRNRIEPFTPGRALKRRSWDVIWADLVRLMPLGLATSRIITVEDQVLEVERRLAAGEDVFMTSRDSSVYKHTGEPCPVCGTTIQTKVLAGRNLYWCGRCQRRG